MCVCERIHVCETVFHTNVTTASWQQVWIRLSLVQLAVQQKGADKISAKIPKVLVLVSIRSIKIQGVVQAWPRPKG